MSHNRISVNAVPPGIDGDIPIDADDVSEGASGGYTPYVDTHLATTDLAELADVDAGVLDGQYLGYDSATTKWKGVSVGISEGSFDWRYPSVGNWSVGSYTYTSAHRWHLGRKTGFGIVVTELPSSGAGPVTGYGYSGSVTTSTTWPTALKLVAGHYLLQIQCRPRLTGAYSVSFQIWNFTQGVAWGPRVFYDDNLGSSPGPTTLIGCGQANLNDEVGVDVVDGRAKVADENWAKFKDLQLIRIG